MRDAQKFWSVEDQALKRAGRRERIGFIEHVCAGWKIGATLGRSPSEGKLLVGKRNHGVHLRGFACWQIAEQQAGQEGAREGEDRRQRR
jgi:hypothetical protein